MAESWSSWGSTGPVIGVKASVSNGKSSATVSFSFMYCKRYNYGAWTGFEANATAYVDGSYYDSVSFYPYGSSYSVGKDYDLITGSRSFSKVSSAYTVKLKFTCTDWGNLSWNNINGNNSSDAQVAEVSVTIPAISSVSAPTISTSYSVRTPNQNSFAISWGAVSNAASYYVTLADSSGAYSDSDSVTTTSKTFTVDNLANYRGSTFTAYVYAVGSGNYANSSTTSKAIAKINSLPGYPSVTRQSGTSLTMQNSISFTVTAGSDNDEQTTSLYYSLDGGATKDVFTSPLEITHDTTGGGEVVSGSNTISFYTYDGYEYSTATTKTFTATFAPVIGSVNTAHTYIENMSGNTNTLVSKTDITFSMSSGTVKSISLYLRSGSSSTLSGDGDLVSTDKYTYNDSTKTITITASDIASLVSDSHYYQFAFTVSDGVASSTKTNWQTVARKPSAPELPTFNSIVNDGLTSEAKSNYYKNKVKITFTNPSNSATRAKVTSIVIVASYGGTKEYTCSTTAGQKTLELDLSQVNGNATTTFKFKITDAAGQTKTSEAAFATMIKSSALAFGGNVINVSNDNLKPNTNTADFDIAHPFAQASGTNNIIYSYEMQISSTKTIIAEYSVININDPTQKTIRVAAAKINAYALTLVTNYDLVYDTIIRIRATDGFGSIIELTKTIKVNFTEPPVFITNTFDIKHDYLTDTSTISTSTGTKITSTSTLNVRMVNFGEGIIFVLPKATDPNNDIAEYRIFLSRNDFYNESSVLKYNEVTFGQTPWLTIPYTTLENGTKDSSYYYYLFKASQYTKNEYFYFKLQARDKTGNTSKEIICQNYIIGCRTVAPTFSAGNIRVDRNGEDVTLNYNFLVTDLGGSATKEGWNRDFYNNYPNFERTITGYTPQASLVIEIAPDQNFKASETLSNANNPIIFTPTGDKSQADFTHKTTSFSGFGTQETYPKIFMRFTLTVSYGLKSSDNTPNFAHSSTIDPDTLPGWDFIFDPSEIKINGSSLNVGDWIVTPTGKIYVITSIEDYGIEAIYNENLNLSSGNRATISSAPQVYTFFGSVPTVAHRAHKVGINTTTIDQDDVLVVENYQGTKYVRFKGTDASNASKTYEITFDLLSGSITGAVIDCGSW